MGITPPEEVSFRPLKSKSRSIASHPLYFTVITAVPVTLLVSKLFWEGLNWYVHVGMHRAGGVNRLYLKVPRRESIYDVDRDRVRLDDGPGERTGLDKNLPSKQEAGTGQVFN